MNRYNPKQEDIDDFNNSLGEYLEEEYNKAQKAARNIPTPQDRVAKAIVYLTKDLDMSREVLQQQG